MCTIFTLSSSNGCANTGMGCQLSFLFQSLYVFLGGYRPANKADIDIWVRATPVACAQTF